MKIKSWLNLIFKRAAMNFVDFLIRIDVIVNIIMSFFIVTRGPPQFQSWGPLKGLHCQRVTRMRQWEV